LTFRSSPTMLKTCLCYVIVFANGALTAKCLTHERPVIQATERRDAGRG
jgi:hypothetical protein